MSKQNQGLIAVSLFVGCLSLHAQPPPITTLTQLQDCIGGNAAGYSGTCQLQPGTYQVPYYNTNTHVTEPSLYVSRSNITITGTMTAGPADTVLQRGSTSVNSLMTDSGASNVTISYLTFDGNRYGFGLPPTGGISCYAGDQATYVDLNLQTGGPYLVEWDDFINGPGSVLWLGGASTVEYSSFGQGGYGMGPTGMVGSETAGQTANRFVAVLALGNSNYVSYNAIAFAGTAGISLQGTYQYAYANLLDENRYEISDGAGGGQLFVGPNAAGVPASHATVAGNVINGGFWPYIHFNPPWYTPVATMCTIPNQGNDGIEAYGIGHGFYNNEVEQNSSYGMIVGTLGANATEQITISSSNPYDNTDTPRYIESNQGHGIYFSGPPQISYMEQGVLLNDVLVQNNTGWGVYLTEVQNSSGYSGFANNSCISNNSAGTVTYPRPPTNSLTSPTPGSYSNYHGMPCPTSGLPQQIPSPSPIGSTWIW